MAGLDAVETVTHGWDANAAAHVGANTQDAASHGDESALTTRASASREFEVCGIQCPAKDVVVAVQGHECLWYIGLAVDYCSSVEKEIDQGRVCRCFFET